LAARTREQPFKVGDCIAGQYDVRGLLGRGGHAFVFDCWDTFMDHNVAVKVIDPPNKSRDVLRRAKKEAQLLFTLNNPNVVRVFTASELPDGMVYIVMEKLEGLVLRRVLVRLGRLNVVESLSTTLEIAKGVAAAHAVGVIHRDLKPDNVMILPPETTAPHANRVKVLDFGIAKFMGQDGVQTTEKDLLRGTPAYMSPEHLLGFGVTVRSDVYQLGTILFELLVGVPPILVDVQEPTFDQLCAMQIHRVTPDIMKLVPEVPDYVAWLVNRSTAKDSHQRFESMAQFAQAIESVLDRYLSNAPREARRVRLLKLSPESEAVGAGSGFQPSAEPPRTLDPPPGAVSTASVKTLPLSHDTEPMSKPAFSDPSGALAPRAAEVPRHAPPAVESPNGSHRAFRTAPQVQQAQPSRQAPDPSAGEGPTTPGNTASSLARTIPETDGKPPARRASPGGERTAWPQKLALSAVALGTVLGVVATVVIPREQKTETLPASTASSRPEAGRSETPLIPGPVPPAVAAAASPDPRREPAQTPATAAPSALAPPKPRSVASSRGPATAPNRTAAQVAATASAPSERSDVDRVRDRLRMLEMDAREPIYGGAPKDPQ
jgi:serine/threonine protein kinase